MQFDIRFPLGLLFLLLGLILLAYGATVPVDSGPAPREINLLWGGIFALFGATTLQLARRRRG